jgi:hypothetical protein
MKHDLSQGTNQLGFIGLPQTGRHLLFGFLIFQFLIGLPSQADTSATQGYVPVSYPVQVLWGDTHLHTTNSLDARVLGVTLDTEDAYRFARGDTITTTTGITARLSRPLDFLVVSDHSDAMGVVDQMIAGHPELMKDPELRALQKELSSGGPISAKAIGIIVAVLIDDYEGPLINKNVMRTVWEKYVDTADHYNEPGRFTAMIGYEWTPTQSGDKLHRNVLYRGDAKTARQLMPFTSNQSRNPQDLWRWMERYEQETGGQVLALAHNGNLSNGKMFPVETNPNTGNAIDAEYVRQRARWEPLFEVTQIKGDSESHPYLSPSDEFADFEVWDRGNSSMAIRKTPDMLKYEYAREALKNGLKLEDQLGANPYQFGMVGSTDSHTGLSTADEAYFFGKFPKDEPNPGRADAPMVRSNTPDNWQTWEMSSSGFAAVWARENTRASIWDAMKRKEVYATTGPRMTVRFFGGWDFSAQDAASSELPAIGYSKGVPMGGTINAPKDRSSHEPPGFLVAAIKDPVSGNLDRVQIVKGWLDANGDTHEKIFEVVWGDAHRRAINSEGKLPSIGNTVNVAEASWTNSIGDAQLSAFWQDPEFDATEPAVYYARIIEIPTARWTAFDIKRMGDKMPEETKLVIQERAYTSPIWYSPHSL